jgi:hypothetical protein
LKEEPRIGKSGVVFEGLEDGFSLHLVVTPEAGIGVAFGSFSSGNLKERPETLLEAPKPAIQEKVPVAAEPSVRTAFAASEALRAKPEKEKPPASSSGRSVRSHVSPEESGTTSPMPGSSR